MLYGEKYKWEKSRILNKPIFYRGAKHYCNNNQEYIAYSVYQHKGGTVVITERKWMEGNEIMQKTAFEISIQSRFYRMKMHQLWENDAPLKNMAGRFLADKLSRYNFWWLGKKENKTS